MRNLDLSNLTPSDLAKGDDEEETKLLRQMLGQAQDFLKSKKWCLEIKACYLGANIPGLLAIVLCEIVPISKQVDRFLWVIVGDLPPAYLVTDDAPDSYGALTVYIWEMRKWVHAVEAGEDTSRLIPVNVEPTAEHAAMLKTRLDLLEQQILPGIQ